MKKRNLFVVILMFAAILFALVGCGNKNEAAEKLLEDVAITYQSGDSASSVTKDVTLGTISDADATLTWSSSNAAVVAVDGTVDVATITGSSEKVTLTATVKIDDETATKEFKLTVIPTIEETRTLLLQTSTMDGVYNPFFYSSAYDGYVSNMINVNLLQLNATGAVVAGDEYPTVAQSYSIYYTDNLDTYAPKDTFEAGDYVVYEMVLKNGAEFSNGNAITAEDVLFNYYTLLDPAYDGSSTLYTLPILGLTAYKTQVPDDKIATYEAKQIAVLGDIEAQIAADGTATPTFDAAVAGDAYNEAEFNIYWNLFNSKGAAYTQSIIDYVMANYPTYFEENIIAGVPASTYDTVGEKVAAGMAMWGYGTVTAADGQLDTLTTAFGDTYAVADLTADIYWGCILQAVGASYEGNLALTLETETAGGVDPISYANTNFINQAADAAGDTGVANITGLVEGTTTVAGEEHETVKIILTQQNPKAILSLGVPVAPEFYYTAGYTYPEDAVVNYGVELNSKAFMDHLKTFNGAPVGAGVYKMISGEDFVQGGDVYFERNTKFETMGGENVYNATIKYVTYKVIDTGGEYAALKAGDVDFVDASADSDTMADLTTQEATLTSVLVDNLGYGYICINPTQIQNINERIALTTVFNLDAVYDYYPNGLADVIYRSMSQVNWAYPEGAEAIYPYDETLAAAVTYFKAAGYTYDEDTKKFTDAPTYRFTLPSAADSHPAGGIFIQAQALLESIGVTSEIKVDANVIANIKDGSVAIYALAWQATPDPDMYQVYDYNSAAESVIANGIKYAQTSLNDDSFGTIEVTKMDGTVETMNQAEAIEYLDELIVEGTEYMLAEERKPIYEKALEVLAQLNIELPTYQRKNLSVYNHTVIDSTTLSSTVTPYWGSMAEMWKVDYAK